MSLFLALLQAACAADNAPPSAEHPLTEVPVEARFGLEDQGDPLSLFHIALDAVLLDDRVLILDASPPYVRVFDSRGNYMGAMVDRGSGPGELQRPLSIGRIDRHSFAVNDPTKTLILSVDGEILSEITHLDRFVRGVVGCSESILELSAPVGFQQPGAVVLKSAEAGETTLAELDSLRSNSRRIHPFLSHSEEGVAVFYTEELHRNRLMWFDCERNEIEEVAIPVLGSQEFFEPLGGGGHALHPAEPPVPAGVARTRIGLLWATLAEEHGNTEEPDSVTIFSLLGEGDRRALRVGGWVQLVDRYEGRLLLIFRAPVSHAILVPEAPLLEQLLEN